MGYYDTAQICKNGHVINKYCRTHPDNRNDFCNECGAVAIVSCEFCHNSIKGDYHSDIVFAVNEYTPPKFCPHCGNPYPWTASKLEAAKQLFRELDGLESDERQKLEDCLDDLIVEKPKTELAGMRFKKIMKKVTKESYETVRTVVTDLVSESIKRTLFGS
jgi:hypothetical protein